MNGRRSLVSLDTGAADAAEARQWATAAMARSDWAAGEASTAAGRTTELEALAGQVQAEVAESASDRAVLHQLVDGLTVQVQTLITSVAAAASAVSVDQVASTLAAQVDAVAAQVAEVESVAAGHGPALSGLAGAVSLLQEAAAGLVVRVAAVESRPVVQVRRARVVLPAVSALMSVDVAVSWPSVMPSADHSVRAAVEPTPGVLSVAVKSQSAGGCTVTVRAGAASVAAGLVLDVVAIGGA